MELPASFVDYTRSLLGEEEYENWPLPCSKNHLSVSALTMKMENAG